MSVFGRILLAAACAVAATAPQSFSQDSANFLVDVPPFMQLRAFRDSINATHPYTSGDLRFPRQLWAARTSSATGSTITLKTQHAFRNLTDPSYKRDVRLVSPRLFGSTGSGWKYLQSSDETDYAAGDEEAVIQIQSARPGNCIFHLEVTFLTGDLATLKGGDYQTVIVGTISEN